MIVDNLEYYGFSLLFFLLPIIINPLGLDIFSLPRVFLFQTLTCLIAISFVLKMIFGQIDRLKISYNARLLSVFAGLMLFSQIFSQHKHTAIWGFPRDHEGLLTWTCYLLIFFLALNIKFDKAKISGLLKIINLQAIIIGLFSISDYILGWQLFDWQQKTEIKRSLSLLGHPSYLGAYAALVLPLLYYSFVKKIFSVKFFNYLPLPLTIAALVFSYSRGAWLAAIISSIVFFFFLLRSGNDKKKPTVAVLSLIGIAILCLLPLGGNIVSRFQSIVDPASSSTSVRLQLYEQSYDLLKDNWLWGVGADNLTFALPDYFQDRWHIFRESIADKAHNFFLDTALNFGLPALLFYLAFLGHWFVTLLRNFKKTADALLLIAISSSCLAYITSLQFHYSVVDLSPLYWFLLGLGMNILISENLINYEDLLIKGRLIKTKLTAVALMLLVLLLFCSSKNLNDLEADYAFSKGLRNSGSLEESIASLENAVRLNPYNSDYYMNLAASLETQAGLTGSNQGMDRAVRYLEDGADKVPDYRLDLALAKLYLENLDYIMNQDLAFSAIKTRLDGAYEKYPNNPDVHELYGNYYALTGQTAEAEIHWLRCQTIDKKNHRCLYNLFLLYDQQDRQEEAKEYLQKYNGLKL